jgi:adenylylsulfate kinase
MTKILWFTGLSGSGKTTLANLLKEEFDKQGKKYLIFDGDEVRKKLHKHLGFSMEDIKENNRLIKELCRKSAGKVDYIIVPIISPFRESREEARAIFGKDFMEIYLDCPYEVCRSRDVKGIYKKAEAGEIENFIGLGIPYEPPLNPEIRIDSAKQDIKKSLKKIIDFI